MAAGEEKPPAESNRLLSWATRFLIVSLGLGGWFWTQSLIGERGVPSSAIGDGLLELLAPIHGFLTIHEGWTDALLIVSSAVIDLLGAFLLARSIFGPSIRPFLGLLVLFGLRQTCQSLCALPPPEGMIWRDPGFPSLLVTYGVSNDLFFSGHTALAVYGAVELGRLGKRWVTAVGVLMAIFEAAVVLALRAHYTMDVFAAVATALVVSQLAAWLAPSCDRGLNRLTAWRTLMAKADRGP